MKIYRIANNLETNPSNNPNPQNKWAPFFSLWADFQQPEKVYDLKKKLIDEGNPEEAQKMEEAFLQWQKEEKVKEEAHRIKNEQQRKQWDEESKQKEIKRQQQELNSNNYWNKNNLDKFRDQEEGLISDENAKKILIGFLQTIFPNDFTTDLILEIYPESNDQHPYIDENVDLWNDILKGYMEEDKTKTEHLAESIRDAMTYFATEHTDFKSLIDEVEYGRYGQGHYITKQEYKKREEQQYKKDEEEYLRKEEETLDQFEHYKKEHGLPEDVDFDEWEAERNDIPDEAHWDSEQLQSFKNWMRDNPFYTSKEREGFFNTWYKNSDYFYEDQEQEEQYWKSKRQQSDRESKREQAQQSTEWKTIEDLLAFATKHGINIGELDANDFKASCKIIYRRLTNYFHPDKYTDENKKKWATEEFKKLQMLWEPFAKTHKLANNLSWYKKAKSS